MKEIKMNEISYCDNEKTQILQRKYKDLLNQAINERIINVSLIDTHIEKMTCDDFKHGLTAFRKMIKLDMHNKRKKYFVNESDSHLLALRKTDSLLNAFKRNLYYMKEIDSLISLHITFIESGDL